MARRLYKKGDIALFHACDWEVLSDEKAGVTFAMVFISLFFVKLPELKNNI